MKQKERIPFSTNPYEQKILKIVFISAGIPIFLVVGFLYCIFSDLIYNYLSSDIADQTLYQFFILLIIILVYYFLFVGIIAYRFAHRLAGTFPRLLTEIDEKIHGKSRTLIRVRKDDYTKDLIERINTLVEQLPKS